MTAWLGMAPGAWPAAITGTAIDNAMTAAATGGIFNKFIDVTFLKGFVVSATTDLIVVRRLAVDGLQLVRSYVMS